MKDNDSPRRIVVSGMSAITPAGIGAEPLIEKITQGRRCLTLRDGHPIAQIEGFEAKQFVRPRKALKVMCREIQTAYAVSILAARQSGIVDGDDVVDESVDLHRLATVFGSEMLYHPSDLGEAMRIGIESARANRTSEPIDVQAFGREGIKKVTPLWLLKYLPNMSACHIGIALGALGPNNTLVTGDVSGVDALIEACGCIVRDVADTAVVSAAGSRISETRFTYRCDAPEPKMDRDLGQIGRPGDPTSTGIILGEGAASLVVRNADGSITSRGDALAEIIATSQRFVPSVALTLPVRNSDLQTSDTRGSSKAIELAIADVLNQSDGSAIDYLISHQNGDPVRDQQERTATAAFPELRHAQVILPIETIGHTGAASGLVEVVTATAILNQHRGQVPRHALAICHTSEGNATALLLRSV